MASLHLLTHGTFHGDGDGILNLDCYSFVPKIPLRALQSATSSSLASPRSQIFTPLEKWGRFLPDTDSAGKEWRRKQVRRIVDEVFERFKTQTDCPNLTFEDLYIAVLLIYNDLNKHSPGPHFDPPSNEQVRVMMEECDTNLDGALDHEEFSKFIERLTVDTLCVVSRGLILTLVVAPSVALVTKKATEGVPGIGRVVHRLPNSVYPSLVALAVVMFQKSDSD